MDSLDENSDIIVGIKYGCVAVMDTGEEYVISEQHEQNQEKHYKCMCNCGKIHYFNKKTLLNKPRYCLYPVPISTNRIEKYKDIENVVLLDKSECIPSEKWCEKYNKYRQKRIDKKEEKRKQEIAKLPREYVENYFEDFVGKQYESLYIEECCDENIETVLKDKVIISKQYKCKCDVCGNEYLIDCNEFGIYPPTAYGYTAYNGYWSRVHCECHYISSFQWIVCKLLIEAGVKYKVEYSFKDLYGYWNTNLLRFDFAIFNEDNTLKCLIECQGEQHYKPVEMFGGERAYEIQCINDNLKREYVKLHDIQLIEISYKNKRIDKVESILKQYGII